jgi:uncharacterized protein YukE
MRVCDLNSGVGQLTQAYSDLKDRWIEAKATWNDETSQAFQSEHLAELPDRLQQLLAAAQRLSSVVEKAEQECGEAREL